MPASGRPGVRRRGVLAGLAALAAAPTLAAEGEQTRIEVEGNRLTYGGKTLRLTGIAVGDPIYIRATRPASDYEDIALDWRANCVRISAFPGHWRTDPGGTAAALAQEITLARAQRLFVIIDWHAIGFPGRYQPIVPVEWGLPPDILLCSLEEAVSFWRAMAETYSHDPAILFELWNEPVADETLWHATGEHWPLFRSAWEDLTAVIRESADNLVLATGGYWAHDLVGVRDLPLSDSRTAYSWHAYPNAERGDPAARLRALGGLHESKPIVVTEWGFCPECSDDLYGTVEDFAASFSDGILNANGLSHTAWCYSIGATPNLLGPDNRPSSSGVFVRELLRRSAGESGWALSG